VGRPLANVRGYIVDAWGAAAPVGVAGELLLGGAGVARGYLGRAGATAERFIPDEFSRVPGARLYRTGDVARRDADGEVEYLGRADEQVKINGYRVELGEVEAIVSRGAGVRECAVVAREDEQGERRLVAYVVMGSGEGEGEEPGGGTRASAGELRSYAREWLPHYMMPSEFVVMEALPRTAHGKLDRRALPASGGVRSQEGGGYVAARDGIERRLVGVWEEVLGVKPVGVRDNFFDLGGHSLLAVRLMARIAEQCGRKLPLATIFQRGTIEHLAELLRDDEKLAPWSPLVLLRSRGAGRPFFCVHAVGGTVFSYAALARSVGESRPFYALQAEGIEGGQSPRSDLKEMAARYVEAVRAVQPTGPYLLGGWSMGGSVAFEMAQQLEATGSKVALLVLFDSRAPKGLPPAAEDHAALLRHFAQDIGFWSDQHTLEVLTHLQPAEQLVYIMAQAKLANLAPPDLNFTQFRRLFNVFKTNLRAVRAYEPQPYAGRITLIKAAEAPGGRTGGTDRLKSLARRLKGLVSGNGTADAAPDETFGWSRLAEGGVEVRTVPGSHYTMLREPHVQSLAEWLGARLREAGDINSHSTPNQK
jgi:thioesterase domain-containing protein